MMRRSKLGLLWRLSASGIALLAGCASSHGGPGEAAGGAENGTSSGASTSATSGASASSGSPVLNVPSTPNVTLVGDSGLNTADAAIASGGLMTTSLTLVIRDFKMWGTDTNTNPDFENATGDDRNIVTNMLGADQKPVYASAAGMTSTTHGKMYFDQWYNDVKDMNIHVEIPITLTHNPNGTWGYDSAVSGIPLSPGSPNKEFFPIDDGTKYATAFGNQGAPHNYSFTTEMHTVFTYTGNQSFTFTGDDDVFVYINGALVINLGGVHIKEVGTINLDSLGLTKGQMYPLDLFNAERHQSESNMSFTTTLNLQPPPPPR